MASRVIPSVIHAECPVIYIVVQSVIMLSVVAPRFGYRTLFVAKFLVRCLGLLQLVSSLSPLENELFWGTLNWSWDCFLLPQGSCPPCSQLMCSSFEDDHKYQKSSYLSHSQLPSSSFTSCSQTIRNSSYDQFQYNKLMLTRHYQTVQCWEIAVRNQRPYSRHFIFFITYELAQQPRVLHYSWLEILVREKHSSFLEPLVSYAKNEVLWIHTHIIKVLRQGLMAQWNIVMPNYFWPNKAKIVYQGNFITILSKI